MLELLQKGATEWLGLDLDQPQLDQFQLYYEDILVQTGTQPVKAHTGYWDNAEVVNRIAQRLKVDYKGE